MKTIVLFIFAAIIAAGARAQQYDILPVYSKNQTKKINEKVRFKIQPEEDSPEPLVRLSNTLDPEIEIKSETNLIRNELIVKGNDGLLKSFYEAFTVEQISYLAENDEWIAFGFFWDTEGNIIKIRFSLAGRLLSIEPEVYARLDESFRRNVKIDPYQEKRINGYGSTLVNFQKVKNGELLLMPREYSESYPVE